MTDFLEWFCCLTSHPLMILCGLIGMFLIGYDLGKSRRKP